MSNGLHRFVFCLERTLFELDDFGELLHEGGAQQGSDHDYN